MLKKRTTVCGNNVPIAFPFDGKHPPAAVFEYDGELDRDGGLTTRLCESASGPLADMLTCTNQYRKRGPPTSCDRYEKIDKRLKGSREYDQKLGAPDAFGILKSVEVSGRLLTYHSVVFEPNRLRMYVAFSQGNRPAPENTPVELDVRSLILASQAARR